MTKPPPRRALRTDGDLTHARILEAAGPLFAASGFAETTSKSVAQAAGVDLASINYHFGSRNGLYQAVLAEAHRRLIRLETLQHIAADTGSSADKLGQLLEMLAGVALGEQGWPAQVLAREILSPTSNARVLLDAEIAPKVALVQQLLGDISGIPPGEPALLRCMVSVAAPCLMLLVAGRTLPGPLKQLVATTPAELARHLHTFALAGLRAVGEQYRGALPAPRR